MELLWEILRFLFFSGLIVLISKDILVKTLRNLAENLNLKPKTVGDIAGVATSVPELLTISASSFNGLISASIYNVLSSNVINLIQYCVAIVLNKNQKAFKNKAIRVDVILVVITIILPLAFILLKTELKLVMAPILILLYFGFKKINSNVHELYLKKENMEIENAQNKENRWERGNKRKVAKNVCVLIATGTLLFVVGNLLGDTLETLCSRFNVPELIVGIVLGFVTSLPELITFFEAQRHYKKVDDDMLGVVEATNNLLTSNILNLFAIQTVGILISSIILKV